MGDDRKRAALDTRLNSLRLPIGRELHRDRLAVLAQRPALTDHGLVVLRDTSGLMNVEHGVLGASLDLAAPLGRADQPDLVERGLSRA